jgi:hypothetical protein
MSYWERIQRGVLKPPIHQGHGLFRNVGWIGPMFVARTIKLPDFRKFGILVK